MPDLLTLEPVEGVDVAAHHRDPAHEARGLGDHDDIGVEVVVGHPGDLGAEGDSIWPLTRKATIASPRAQY
jgi:hypothetical protein